MTLRANPRATVQPVARSPLFRRPGSTPAVPFSVARRHEVIFTDDYPANVASTGWQIPAPTPGNTLVFALIPTLGEAVVTSFTDNLANVYTHDRNGGNGHFFRLSQCPNAPTHIFITVDTLIGCRLYGLELTGCPAGVQFVSGSEASYAAQEGQSFPFNTIHADCLGMAMVHTNPSRFPVLDAGSSMSRLDTSHGGAPNDWVAQPVSEHLVYKLFPTIGANSMGTTWAAGGTCSGTTSHVLLRKT